MQTHLQKFLPALAALLLACASRAATTNEVIGSYANWPVVWAPLNLDDPADGFTGRLDFVGDATNRCGYWAMNSQYVFFRMRVYDANPAFSDAHFVLIDRVGWGTTNNLPDYGFVWDSKMNDPANHGLEMQVLNAGKSNVTTWGSVRMDDIDNTQASKGANDINGPTGAQRTTDGYLRYIAGAATTNFGNTTFIDFAVSWSYLQTYTALTSNQAWRIAFACINNNDPNDLNGDIAGGASAADAVTKGWNAPIVTTTYRSTTFFFR